MKIKYDQNILPPEANGPLSSKIEYITWSSSLKKIAFYTPTTNQVSN